MENKCQVAMSRITVSKILTEDIIAYYVNRLFNEKPNVFIHSVNVAYLVAEIAYKMGFLHYDDLIRGALLHDIGKLTIPDEVLNKTEKLTDEEWLMIKNHTVNGYEMVKDNEDISQLVKDIILYHHEKLDGSGYPNGFNQSFISQDIQIVTVCDIYDALTERRCYGKEYTMKEAISILLSEPVNTNITKIIKKCEDK